MDDIGFILPCYLISFGAVIALCWRVVRRGRVLADQVPDKDKPWT